RDGFDPAAVLALFRSRHSGDEPRVVPNPGSNQACCYVLPSADPRMGTCHRIGCSALDVWRFTAPGDCAVLLAGTAGAGPGPDVPKPVGSPRTGRRARVRRDLDRHPAPA